MQQEEDLSARGRSGHPDAQPAEASHPRRGSDGETLANASGGVLSSQGGTAYPYVVFDASGHRGLRDLNGVKDVVTDDMPFLSGLHTAATMEANRMSRLTAIDSMPLVEMDLGKVTLSVKDTAEIDVPLISSFGLCTSLIIHQSGDLNRLEELKELKKLTELKFVGFGISTFPLWVRVLPRLEYLSFEGGVLAVSEVDEQESAGFVLLPDSVKRLELSCIVPDDAMQIFLSCAGNLTELMFKTQSISKGLKIDEFSDLRVLKLLPSSELDEEVFNDVATLKNLESFHFCGCLNLTAASLSFLTGLAKLRELCIHNCVFGDGVCEKIMSMQSLTTLRLFSCWGVSLFSICQNPNLKVLWIVDCMGARVQLSDLLTYLRKHLNHFRITE